MDAHTWSGMNETDDPPADALLHVAGAPLEDGIALGVDPELATPARPLHRAGAVIAPAMVLANLLGYTFNLVLSRWLGPRSYGELGALLGVSLVGTVPALALQPVVARRIAAAVRSGAGITALSRALMRTAWLTGCGTALLAVAAAPAATAFLHLESPMAMLWLAAAMLTLPPVFAVQGVLQGQERFVALAAVYVLAAGLRLLGAIVIVALGGGVAGALAGAAAGSLVTIGVAHRSAIRHSDSPARQAGTPGGDLRTELIHAVGAMLSLIVVANIDVPLARHYLSPDEAGLYAVGAVLAKGAFWGPQFIAVIAFPRMSDRALRTRLLRRSALVVGGFGIVTTGVLAAFGELAVIVVGGDAYAGLAPDAWLFGALGSALAMAQLLLYSGLAAADRRLTGATWLVAATGILAVAVARHGSLVQIAGTSLCVAAGLSLVGAVLASTRRRADEPAD